MCVCVRARARAREARSDFWPAENDFWEMRVLLGFTPVMTFGDFWLLAKPVKFYRRAYMFWWNWFQDSRKTQVLNYLERIYYATKLTRRKNLHTKKSWLFRNEWSSFDRLLQPELLTTRGSGSWRSPIVNQKTLIDLGSHSPRTKFYSLQHQLLELDLTRLTFFGVRYVLNYSPNHSSAQDVEHLDHRWSMKYWSDIRRPPGCYVLHCNTCPCHWENQITYLETQV